MLPTPALLSVLRDNLTQDDIPAIVEVVVEAMHARANAEPGGEDRTTRHNTTARAGSTWCGVGIRTRSGRQLQVPCDGTNRRDTQTQGETSESIDPVSEITEVDTDHHNTESTVDQQIGE